MCRLNILVKRKKNVPIDTGLIINFLHANSENFDSNDDGEGIVVVQEDGTLFNKSSLDRLHYTDVDITEIITRDNLIIADHTRRATTPIIMDSVQPFRKMVQGKLLTFMHNGVMSLKGFSNRGKAADEGESDSKFLFNKICEELIASNIDKRKNMYDVVKAVFDRYYIRGSFSIFMTYGKDAYYFKNANTSMHSYITSTALILSTSTNMEKFLGEEDINYIKGNISSNTFFWFKHEADGLYQYSIYTRDFVVSAEPMFHESNAYAGKQYKYQQTVYRNDNKRTVDPWNTSSQRATLWNR